jgi:NAD(P)-dependent dehydrogenase (short-subunit alcohol dehydrogenase family)
MADTGEGTVAVVTGANRGIGLEVCRQLASRGWTVVLGARDEAKGREAARSLGSSRGEVIARPLDVTNGAGVERLRDWLGQRFGRLDVLVNNAGINYDTWQRAATADLAVVQETWDTNVLGPWRTTEILLPLLRRSARGRIVNVSSEAGSLAGMEQGGTPAYRVSKAALNAFTRILAAELRADGILVNAVCPGWVATDMGGAGGRPVQEGAASVVWAATLPDGGPTGGFFRDGRPLRW